MSKKNVCKFSPAVFSDTLALSCFVWETDPTVMQAPYVLEAHRMLLVTEGEGVVSFSNSKIPVKAGDLLFGFQGEIFCVESPRDLSYLYLHFSGNRANELLRRFDLREGNRSAEGMDGLIPLWKESLSRASEETIDLAAESILLYTFSRLFGNLSTQNDLVRQIVQMTEENFTDPTLSLSSLAQELSYHPKYLSQQFKKKMGVGYTEYLCSLRLRHAVSLFDHGLDSVKNVALLSGFTDPLYFSLVFKKKLGVSPSEYQKGNRK